MAARAGALDVDPVSGQLAALLAEVAELRQRVSALEAARPRDAADGELRQQLATSTEALPFRSKDLFAHGGVDAALRRALVRADCFDVETIGLWLRRERGTRDGVTIERLRRRQWRAYTSDTSSDRPEIAATIRP
jgi:hypothetical protein